VFKNRKLSNTAKLSVLNSAFVPIITHGSSSSLMSERVLSHIQTAEIEIFASPRGKRFSTKSTYIKFVKPWTLSHF